MQPTLLILVIGLLIGYGASTTKAGLVRERRSDIEEEGLKIITEIMQLVNQCKKPDAPQSNATDIITRIREGYDISCLINGFRKIFDELAPKQNSRSKRDSSTNIIMSLLKLQQDIQKCKKSDAPPANSTNAVENFIENIINDYDIGCLISTLSNFVKSLEPSNNQQSSRRKRDISQVVVAFIQFQQNVQKCKKEDAPTNSGNIIEQIINGYDLSCLITTVTDFIKTIVPSNNQRSKRSFQLADGTCFLMAVVQREPKISEIVKAFQPPSNRSKRAADSKKLCDDFGTLLDGILEMILDFAPNQPTQ